MKQTRLWLTTIVVLLCSLAASAHDFEVGGIYYNINSTTDLTVAVTYRGSSYNSYSNEYSGAVTVPETVTYNNNTYSVTSIGGSAFDGCSSLTAITIPESVTSIGYSAFDGCSSLTSITLPEGVTSIADCAFNDCTSLKEVIIADGSTILSLGRNDYDGRVVEGTFYDCPLEKVYLGRNIDFDYRGEGYSPFYNSSRYPTISLGENMTSIPPYLFYNYSSLTSVTIPKGVTTIKSYAFEGCSSLTAINIPESVTSIGYRTFSNCSSLISITIPESVTLISGEAFYGCSNLNSVIIGSGVLSIGSDAFSTPEKVIWLTNTPPTGYANAKGSINYVSNDQYTSLSNVKVYPYLSSVFEVDGVKYVPVSPSERTCDAIDCAYDSTATAINVSETASFKGIAMTVKEVMPYTFYGNNHIKEVSVSHKGNIGDYAFYNCDSIQSVELSNEGDVGSSAFYGCSSLESVTFGDKVSSLGYNAFSGCTSLQEIVIPDSVKSVGTYCFYGCTAMKSVVIGNGLTGIKEYTFANCPGLESVMIGNGVSSISDYAFQYCSSLPTITIPQAVTTIGDNVFARCSSLADVIIADRTEPLALGSNGSSPLFVNCPLDSVYIGGKITYNTTSSKGYSPFYRKTSLRTVVITDREEQIYNNEFYGCTNLQNVTIGNGVKSIGNYAFSGCSSLEGFSFGSNMETIGDEAFSDCTNLTSITSHAAVPPTCGTQALDDINKWECVLGVPQGNADAYYAADQWKEFFFIDDVVEVEKYTLNFMVDGEMYHTERLAHKSTIVIPEMPVKEGYTFNGWSEVPATMPAEDVTISGTFIINKYFVTFKIGDEIISSDSLEYSTEIVVPESPEREGHTFNGWGEVAETVPAGDVTYEGSYAVNSYILTFIVDDETILQTSVPYGKEITLPETPVKEGYAFNGWSEVPATMPANDVVVYGSFAKLSVEVMTINDTDSHFSVIEDTECGSINYIRYFADTEWQALFVPFEIPVTEEFLADFEVADLNNVHQYDHDDDGVTDETVIEAFKITSGTLEANYPYLIRAKEAGEKSIVVTDATLYTTEKNSIDCSSVREKFTFTGTYSAISSDALVPGEGYYTLIDGEWQPVTEDLTLGAFRFYLKVDNRNGDTMVANTIRMRVVGDDDDNTTDIENSEIRKEKSEIIYDLQGRRVENLAKGIYIINGKKIMIK